MTRIPELTIDKDGPYSPTDHRRWLARQLMDSKLTEDEAFEIVFWSPAMDSLRKKFLNDRN